jgi:DNA-binding NarL/FixJ family response regulator
MIQVLIVDDHQILRDGIKALLHKAKTIKVIGEINDGSKVLDFISTNKPDVILMDILMKEVDGIQATQLIKSKYPEIKILALSMNNQYSYIESMLKAGASGYILKNTGGDELVHAITMVFEGKTYFSEEVTGIVMKSYLEPEPIKKSDKDLLNQLTKREIEILKLIAQEFTNQEIADKLFISKRTVDTHRRNLLQKIEVKNSIGLIRFAYNNGLIED